jgi:hypothetical protein
LFDFERRRPRSRPSVRTFYPLEENRPFWGIGILGFPLLSRGSATCLVWLVSGLAKACSLVFLRDFL